MGQDAGVQRPGQRRCAQRHRKPDARAARAGATRARLVPVFTDREAFIRAAGLSSAKHASILVLNRDGKVLARAEGSFNEDKAPGAAGNPAGPQRLSRRLAPRRSGTALLQTETRCPPFHRAAAASQTLGGVSGICNAPLAPCGPPRASASATAFTTLGVAPMVPSSPTPLTPSGLFRQGVDLVHLGDELAGDDVGARRRIVHQAAGERLAALAVVHHVLAQRLADALHRAAIELAAHDHRVDHAADVVDAAYATTCTSPVCGSISTSLMWQPLGQLGPGHGAGASP